jgi:hypothetical protein
LTASEYFIHGVADRSTKQADSWPSGFPAFMSVGELGNKPFGGHQIVELFSGIPRNPPRQSPRPRPPMAFATRRNKLIRRFDELP